MTEWAVYYGLEPWGSERDDVRALYVAAMAVAPYSKGDKVRPREFFPHLFRPDGPQSVAEQKMIARAFCRAHGGTIT